MHPSWGGKGPRPIDARMEPIATNGMFRGLFPSGRAVEPMTSYYEWLEADGGKDPYVVHQPDGKLLHAAGLTAAPKPSPAASSSQEDSGHYYRPEYVELVFCQRVVGKILCP